ncbi:MAG: sigma-54-dependent Fis family transcriptional regulator [Deltaproteobacteria bacterium]|nr:sigma-54-dependent Fis family transcriptional regulator [Deltaproteobacteria bacterium]
MNEILILEDEPSLRQALVDLLGLRGDHVVALGSIAEAEAWLMTRAPDLLITDLRLPDGDGLELVRRAQDRGLRAPVLVMTAFASVERAVEALRRGASDFLVKPFDNRRFLAAVEAALVNKARLEEVELRAARVAKVEDQRIVSGGGLEEVVRMLPRVAESEATVLILGESGTGKELVARALHSASGRKDGPFVSLNCAALPATLLEAELFGFERGSFTGAHARRVGFFESASGGTLFLDEIGDMPLEAQAKLLRVLEQRELTRLGGREPVRVDVRVVAATHRNLDAAAAEGRFRADLLYRLAVIVVELPPLRDRPQDLPGLVRHFLERARKRSGGSRLEVGPEVLTALEAHSWPGNVRELQNFVERSVVHGKFDLDSLRGRARPLSSRAEAPAIEDGQEPETTAATRVRPLKEVMDEAERGAVVMALRATGGNKAQAARLLGVSYKTLFNKIHEHGIREQVVIHGGDS